MRLVTSVAGLLQTRCLLHSPLTENFPAEKRLAVLLHGPVNLLLGQVEYVSTWLEVLRDVCESRQTFAGREQGRHTPQGGGA